MAVFEITYIRTTYIEAETEEEAIKKLSDEEEEPEGYFDIRDIRQAE